MSTPPAPAFGALAPRLAELSLRDAHRLGRRLEGARKIRKPEARAAVLAEIEAEVAKGESRMAERAARVPAVSYPEQLPVSQRKDDIAAAIRDHQVVIVAGETGSGKTTQIPKICMELGRGVRGMIGHTQPRRIAARTVAERVAEELRTPLGEAVGWKVRFTDQVNPDATFVKLMTDGILLAEIQTDGELRAYDTIIIDEAHERSLNIDFLLGYLAQLLPKRPDLKVVITSATIDPERFSRHFGDAPIVEVSGRTYPVEVRYRPLLEEEGDDADRDQITAICDAVEELQGEGKGDILVFLSGEREIRDTADALIKKQYRFTEVLPLYARLSHAEQHRVFQPHTGRRIVLATNVAETSLTVPGIKYVIDPGFARISRYSHRTKVQRLPIEAISQASANQRKGRCGRTSDGVCIRLYSEDDFEARPEFTDAEILRTNLASVILQMTAAGLGDIEKFPFIDPPDHRNIRDGVQLLQELGALDPAQKDVRKRLTPMGRKLSQLPVDPRLARMVVEADKNGCAREVMVIAAALSIQDPRERPADKQAQADQQHARFKDETSDFLAYLNLWRYVREQQKERGSSSFRRMCKQEYLNFLRIREWQDIYSQLRTVAKQMDIHPSEDDAPEQHIHLSLLAGLLSHIGMKDVKEAGGETGRSTGKNEYLGARSAKFAIFPGSALFKKPPRFVMSAELVETSRLWARVNARIEPEWVEPLAEHLLKRTYSEPHWEKDQAAVMAYEKVTLYGVPIVAQRKINYGRIDAEASRELFIRNALVEGDWRTHHKFFADNRRLLSEVEELEHRARRRDIVVDDDTLFDFYDTRVPEHVVSGAHFDSWWKHKRHEQPDFLDFEREMLIRESAEAVTKADYPDSWRQGQLKFRVTYQFEPGADADGVTVHVPLHVLNQVTDEGFDWQIPGLREEVVTELIRSLPKPIRRNYVPAPNFAQRFLDRAVPLQEPLPVTMARELKRMVGVPVTPEDFDWSRVPDHLKITFRIVDERRRKLAEDKDLESLRLRLKPKARQALSQAAAATAEREGGESLERKGLDDWTIGSLTRVFETRRAGQPVKAYPALVDDGPTANTVSVRLFDTEAEQTEAMWKGTRRLILRNIPVNPAKFASEKLTNAQKLALSANPHGSIQALFDDCAMAAADRLIAEFGGPAWDESSYRKLYDKVRAEIVDTTVRTVGQVQQVLAAWQACERRLKSTRSPALLANLADVRGQLDSLVKPGFVTEAGLRRLPDLMRYLVAADRRLQQMPTGVQRDTARMEKVHEMRDEYAWLLEQLPQGRPVPSSVLEIRWMIEELRVSYFAHALGTAYPVSDKRIVKAIDAAVP
ncbi:ATP-dependent RNA helicase HrpA [Streptomyces europaeiscabiei]|uniref:ATP-dependent RNA helicase HrpA n=1 Tax=Streptomyces europaeiscabiei TaxID=146819 RepID=UPI0006283F4C|nr:ATP-dependent RNA helicase HrpA [Streptomyces europaeiscabiei]MDX2774200.1 ATP-dependent RNA helicase HrpA [Streptomyces europaeiscabiei]MDX3670626.1 ATP-dependent RNA helicase HrpA [Streptomyces europaeiscabiei]MDX3715546.1 ATP-dependent RNA helicase HrpA [Streptomyces europaeiscabiei]MDX3783954.1 ATP-dependent RNA helicase HrpA [Streptomyces europaeiscabiei]MDX3839073.1 ATP-dependent RNA helicase HrpA [Streptomyces europaeiscabiei]